MNAVAPVPGKRVRWEVVPRPGVFRWAVVRDDEVQRLFLFKHRALADAVDACQYELGCHDVLSELTVMTRDGRVEDKRTYGDDPRLTRG